MSDSRISPSLGRRIAARVEEVVDAAGADASAMAARAEEDRRALLRDAHEQAGHAFDEAAAAAREAAGERVARLAELRRAIAERTELLIAEADEPEQLRQQVEALLVALAETEAAVEREVAVAATPPAPAELAERAPAPAPTVPDPEPAAAVEPEREPEAGPEPEPNGQPAAPFPRWRRNRFNGQLLAVMRMAVGGMSRAQVARELDQALPSEDREALLDDVFGRARAGADGQLRQPGETPRPPSALR